MRRLPQRESYVFVLTQTRVFPNFFYIVASSLFACQGAGCFRLC